MSPLAASPLDIYKAHTSGAVWSDIQDHLPRLRTYAKGNVFEIGVRTGLSTAALLLGLEDKQGGHLWSCDVADCDVFHGDPDWTFLRGNSVADKERILAIIPKELDVLFIDSDHTYMTTRLELEIYAPLVKKNGGVILMHDTDLNGSGVKPALDEYAKTIGKTPVFYHGSYGMGELRP